jgi:hypothetical protein
MKPPTIVVTRPFFLRILTVHENSWPLRIGTALLTEHDVPVLQVRQVRVDGSVVEITTL